MIRGSLIQSILGAAVLAALAASSPSLRAAPDAAVGLGVDVDFYTGPIPEHVWTRMKEAGHRFAIVQAWGGRSRNEHAASQLAGARTIADMRTAAYVLLNYDDKVCPTFASPTRNEGGRCLGEPIAQETPGGRWQAEQGLAALGAEAARVSFVAIDVEWFLGDPPSPAAAARARRRQSIADAIGVLRERGIRPVIYTRNAKGHWSDITGCDARSDDAGCRDFYRTIHDARSPVALWDVDTGSPELAGFAPHGGWTERKGRQYRLDANAFGLSKGRTLDLNVFDLSLFGARR